MRILGPARRKNADQGAFAMSDGLKNNQVSDVPGPGRWCKAAGGLPQQQRRRHTDSQHHQAQKTQPAAESESDAFKLGKAAKDRRGLLF